MATLLAHIKVVEGKEKFFEDLSRELFEKTHANEDQVIHYEYWRGRNRGTYYALLAYPSYLDFMLTHQITDHHEEVTAKYDGVIEDITAAPGDQVGPKQLLAVVATLGSKQV